MNVKNIKVNGILLTTEPVTVNKKIDMLVLLLIENYLLTHKNCALVNIFNIQYLVVKTD